MPPRISPVDWDTFYRDDFLASSLEPLRKLARPVEALSCLFPDGTKGSRDAAAPDDLVAEIFMDIFKEMYPLLRRMIIAYGMPALREARGCFIP